MGGHGYSSLLVCYPRRVGGHGYSSLLVCYPRRVGGHGYSSLLVCYPRRAWAATGIVVCWFVPRPAGIVVCWFVCLFVCLSRESLLTWMP